MSPSHKSVPAIERCFAILDLLTKNDEPLGISDISNQLELNKSTVFNIVYTLVDLNVLDILDGGFGFGPRFFVLGSAAGKRSELIRVIHPYLERIHHETGLSSFLGIHSDLRSVLIDKADSTHGVKISSEIGMRMPLLAGAGIKAMLSVLSPRQVNTLLSRVKLKPYTPKSIIDKNTYKKEIEKVRKEGIAFDKQEYIEGMAAVAIPVKVFNRRVQAAIWVVGLAQQLTPQTMQRLGAFLKDTAEEINRRLN